jgi:hypothetical protein
LFVIGAGSFHHRKRPRATLVAESSVAPPPVSQLESHMPQFEYTPKDPNIYDRPRCPKCTTQMYLVRIEPDQPGHDKRTFKCPECDHSESVVVKLA